MSMYRLGVLTFEWQRVLYLHSVNTYPRKVNITSYVQLLRLINILKGKSGVNRGIKQKNMEPSLALRKDLEPRMWIHYC